MLILIFLLLQRDVIYQKNKEKLIFVLKYWAYSFQWHETVLFESFIYSHVAFLPDCKASWSSKLAHVAEEYSKKDDGMHRAATVTAVTV